MNEPLGQRSLGLPAGCASPGLGEAREIPVLESWGKVERGPAWRDCFAQDLGYGVRRKAGDSLERYLCLSKVKGLLGLRLALSSDVKMTLIPGVDKQGQEAGGQRSRSGDLTEAKP